MRTAAPLLLVLAGCLAACWALSLYTGSIPGLITGQVIDWTTGQPAPYVDLLSDKLNSAKVVARTDAHGRFLFKPDDAPNVYFLFAAWPRHGRLLQATFGQTIVMYGKNQQVRNVLIPAIPATELSGHVYGSDRKPIPGCYVSALTRAHRSKVQIDDGSLNAVWDHAQADDPNSLTEVENSQTERDGMYVFHRLGVDRYFVLARCQKMQPQTKSPSFTWAPMLYPNVNGIAAAQEILLLPGERRTGIDFHMQWKRAYTLTGNIIFGGHTTPMPWLEGTYFQNLLAFRSDRDHTSTWLGEEPCWIAANAGTFRCDSLLPGEYTLYFQITWGLGATAQMFTQAAKARYNVQAKAKNLLTVQLQEVQARSPYQIPNARAGGDLDFKKLRTIAPDGKPTFHVIAWGPGPAGAAHHYMAFWETMLRLPTGDYNVAAFESSFVLRSHRSYLGESSKIDNLLMQHGTHIELHTGQTIKPALPVITTAQVIDIALASLTAHSQSVPQ